MTKLETFQAMIADLGQATIDQIQARLDAQHYWDDAFFADVLVRAKRSTIRQCLRQLKGPDGRPLWYSVLEAAEEDTGQRRYKQLALLNPEDFRQVISAAIARVDYWQQQAAHLRDELHKRYGEQLALPWE